MAATNRKFYASEEFESVQMIITKTRDFEVLYLTRTELVAALLLALRLLDRFLLWSLRYSVEA